MFAWPKRAEIARALKAWAEAAVAQHPELARLGCFGSFARGDWGMGSDLDLVAVVESSDKPFTRRSLDWDLGGLPVPADLLVYTREEWQRLQEEGGRFSHAVTHEATWLYSRPANP